MGKLHGARECDGADICGSLEGVPLPQERVSAGEKDEGLGRAFPTMDRGCTESAFSWQGREDRAFQQSRGLRGTAPWEKSDWPGWQVQGHLQRVTCSPGDQNSEHPEIQTAPQAGAHSPQFKGKGT